MDRAGAPRRRGDARPSGPPAIGDSAVGRVRRGEPGSLVGAVLPCPSSPTSPSSSWSSRARSALDPPTQLERPASRSGAGRLPGRRRGGVRSLAGSARGRLGAHGRACSRSSRSSSMLFNGGMDTGWRRFRRRGRADQGARDRGHVHDRGRCRRRRALALGLDWKLAGVSARRWRPPTRRRLLGVGRSRDRRASGTDLEGEAG